ncbi:transforming growth factor beta activator LRRC32-like isoform X2 [Protopterus annectens]|uniref:transforming growth factor beta activator LRRC32-like isoform X2 n=1 Tax=Protopterus annectens TaxID=7888 RepID=UPI001CFAA126|nr:transforming growth factor beta activator LRRC32-like isoform X2 [Protopterus annectens]
MYWDNIKNEMEVHCHNKSLHHFPTDLPRNIDKIDLSKNHLKNITRDLFQFYDMLRYLDLSSNKISSIEPGVFQNMTMLEELNLANNLLSVLASSNGQRLGCLPNVKKLNLSSNKLYTGMTEYFIHDAPSLQYLSLTKNSITGITQNTFRGAPNLISIDLNQNMILEIEEGAFETLLNLTSLYLHMNSITCILDFNLFSLQILDLSRNSIESFQPAISEQEFKLQWLNLKENKLITFPTFPKRSNLTYVNLSHNIIQRLNVEAPEQEDGYMGFNHLERSNDFFTQSLYNSRDHSSFHSLSSIQNLDLSYNEIKTISNDFFESMVSLQFLNLSNNCLQSFVVTKNDLNSLLTLDLSYNSIKNLSIDPDTLKHLRIFYLQHNHLYVLSANVFMGLSSLNTLYLCNNNISICGPNLKPKKLQNGEQVHGCVFFYNISKLQHLHLSHNSIPCVPRNAFYWTPLQYLDLSLNEGIQIMPGALSGLESFLEHLYLQGNKLETLNIDLPQFSQLQKLNLSGNRLSSLPPWSQNSVLELLDLRNNCFSNLQNSNILYLEKTLKMLYLGGNPFRCCQNMWLINMINASLVTIPDQESIRCHYQKDSVRLDIEKRDQYLADCEEDIRNVNVLILVTIVLVLVLIITGFVSFSCFHKQIFKHHFKA